MSLRREYAQNVLRSYVVTQSDNNSETGAYFFAESDFDDWYSTYQQYITKLGKSVYAIVGSIVGVDTFVDIVRGTGGGANNLNHTLPTINYRKTLKDMGKEIIIGNRTVARLLVFRRVQLYTNSGDSGTLDPEDTGYIVVENNCTDLAPNDRGGFSVRVARI